MKTNYHTHHKLCRHATGETKEYVERAIERDVKILGFSDHAPFPNDPFGRMKMSELQEYIHDVLEVKRNYNSKIQIFLGLETEYLPEHHDHIKKLKRNVDYMILGQHYIEDTSKRFWENIRSEITTIQRPNYYKSAFYLTDHDDVKKYSQITADGIESEMFDILAHPDIYMNKYNTWDPYTLAAARDIIKTAVKNHIPLELNAKGIRKGIITYPDGETGYAYPHRKFWELAAIENAPVIIGSDAHAPDEVFDKATQAAYKMAEEMNLNVLEVLPIKSSKFSSKIIWED